MDQTPVRRIHWLDLVKTLAILCVILCHTTENIYGLDPSYLATVGLRSELFDFTAYTLGRLGVPFFLMASGYLLLDRSYDDAACRRFWRKNWLHLLVVTEIWILILDGFLATFGGESIQALAVVKELFFMKLTNPSHMWYMPMILGLYPLVPYVANGLRTLPVKRLYFPVVLFAAFACLPPTINVILSALGQANLSNQFSQGFSGGAYGIYFLMGYLVKQGCFRRWKPLALGLVTGVGVAGTVGMLLLARRHNVVYGAWYDCAFLLVASCCLFELLSRLENWKPCPVVRFLSRYSFGVYLIHNMVIYQLKVPFQLWDMNQPVKVILLWAVAGVISYLLAWLIDRIPRVGGYLLYCK